MQTYTIYNEINYFRTIAQAIADTEPGNRVSLISMAFEPSEPRMQSVMRELMAAAKRGVRTLLVIDAHSFVIHKSPIIPTGPLYWHRDILKARFPRHFYEKARTLEALREAGGRYEIINQPITWPAVPIAGRSHIKATVINNEAYVGGCNLGHSEQMDYMVRIQSAATATIIQELIDAIVAHKSVPLALEWRDRQVTLDDQTTLFIDAGVARQSLIFQEALHLIDQAREWIVITCQFLPGGVTGKHLALAQARGVRVYSIFNHPTKHDTLTIPAHYLVREREKLRYSKELLAGQLPKSHQRLHAKLIATEQGGMIGSHNYVTTGIRLGTAEIALLRQDPAFAHEAASLLIPRLSGSIADKLRKDTAFSATSREDSRPNQS